MPLPILPPVSRRRILPDGKSCIVNRQIGVGNSKYVIVFDPLLTGHVIRRMRSGRVRISNANEGNRYNS